MTILVTILVIVALIIAAILIYAAMKPDQFIYARETTINAPAEKIFPLINDFKRWTEWSPYEHKDPNLKRTYGRTTVGKGATYNWDGDKNIGSGRMEILDAPPPEKVVIKLDFFRPFKATNTAVFTLTPEKDATAVTWAMEGRNTFMSKVICSFMNVDKMVGDDFAKGLASMKKVVEGA